MHTLDDARAFVARLLDLEHEVQRARVSEPDDQYDPKLAALNNLFASEVTVASAISRAAGQSAAELDEQRRHHLATVRRRPLFAIDERAEPRFGRVFTVRLGLPYTYGGDEPALVYHVATVGDELRVVSYDRACRECDGAGRLGDRACPDCDGVGWVHGDGVALELSPIS